MLLVDTNVWLSAADVRSERHDDSVALLSEHPDELATTVPVIAESSWLILDRLGPEAQARFLDLVISRTLDLVDLTHQDWERVAALCRQYADLRLDATDASLIAVAERMRLGSIATYNHRELPGRPSRARRDVRAAALNPSFAAGRGRPTWNAR